MPLKINVEKIRIHSVVRLGDKIAIIWTVICVVCWSIQLQSYLIHLDLSISSIFDCWINFTPFSYFISVQHGIFSPPCHTFCANKSSRNNKKAESVAGKIMKLNWISSFSIRFLLSFVVQCNAIFFVRFLIKCIFQ